MTSPYNGSILELIIMRKIQSDDTDTFINSNSHTCDTQTSVHNINMKLSC